MYKEDEFYMDLTDDEVIEIINHMPNKINQKYFQNRILHILNRYRIINDYGNRNQIAGSN